MSVVKWYCVSYHKLLSNPLLHPLSILLFLNYARNIYFSIKLQLKKLILTLY